MDQILHRKLINEKNNLQLEVAKANKQIAKLMETVQQYEAVLASLNEADIKIPTQIGLARAGARGVSGQERVQPKPDISHISNVEPESNFSDKKHQSPQHNNPNHKHKFIKEALLRGPEAMKRKAQMSGKKLPTAAEAAKKMEKLKAEKELEDAGLGKLKKQRKQIDEVLDSTLDKKLAANVAKHSLQQKKDEQKMLGHMPGVTPARMTLLAQQAKNRESLLNRLGKGKEMGENGMGTSADMDLRRLQRKSGIDLGATIGPEGIHVSGDPTKTAAITQRHMQLQKAAGAKPARPHYYIKGNPAHG